MLRRSGIACAGLLALFSAQLQAAPIDTASRAEVVTAFGTYTTNKAVPAGWNGSVAGCNAGTTSDAYMDAAIGNANFYRNLAGLADVNRITDATVVTRARQAALMMAANKQLNHFPPDSWLCATADGIAGAGASNLSLGMGTGPGSGTLVAGTSAGAGSIDGYMSDAGTAVDLGHRRWILNQAQVGFAIGDIADLTDRNPSVSSSALRVFAASPESNALFEIGGTVPNPKFAPWPSPNFVPYQVMPQAPNTAWGEPANPAGPYGYWSISHPGANFAAATVTVTDSVGAAVTVSGVTQLASGYGDNTLEFSPHIAPSGFHAGMADASYKVVVAGVTNASDTSYCYTVTVFDPSAAGDATAPDLCASTPAHSSQSISFTSVPPSPGVVGDTYTPTATATSGLPVTFTASGSCTYAAPTVTFNSTGTCTISANQAGGASGGVTYDPATQMQQIISVGRQDQTIHFVSTPPTNATAGGAPYSISASASSGLGVTLTSATPAVCTVTGVTVSFLTAGNCTINANQAGNASYNAAAQVQQTITVKAQAQTITFAAQTTPSRTFVAASTFAIAPTATATSGLAVTYSSLDTSVCTVAGTTVTMVAAGSCQIAADQPGNGTYAAAPRVTQVVALTTASLSSQTITVTTPDPATASSASPASVDDNTNLLISASASSGLAVSLTVDPSSDSGACTVSGMRVYFTGEGQCIISVNQGGNASYAQASPVQLYFKVSPPLLPPPPSAAAAVPALDDWALALLAALLAAAALAGAARRRS